MFGFKFKCKLNKCLFNVDWKNKLHQFITQFIALTVRKDLLHMYGSQYNKHPYTSHQQHAHITHRCNTEFQHNEILDTCQRIFHFDTYTLTCIQHSYISYRPVEECSILFRMWIRKDRSLKYTYQRIFLIRRWVLSCSPCLVSIRKDMVLRVTRMICWNNIWY